MSCKLYQQSHNFDGDEIKLAFTSLWLFTKGSNKTESKIKDKNICSVFSYFYICFKGFIYIQCSLFT